MKIVLLYFLVGASTAGWCQPQIAKDIDALEQKIMMDKKLTIRFERLDTTDAQGRHFEVARSYYFDQIGKNLLLITAYENQVMPGKGLQVVYTFSGNKLAKISAIPSEMTCRMCKAEYYFTNDSLVYKNELNYAVGNTLLLLNDSRRLAAKVLRSVQQSH